MAKLCIMGTCRAGSNEHVFPAALGGRRTNRQIYCTPHNNALGRHVAILEAQLSFMNAQLRIRHDRHDAPKAFLHTRPDGKEYSILGQKIEELMPAVDLEKLPVGQQVKINISSMEAFERLREKATREHGLDLRIKSQEPPREIYNTERVQINLAFGGKPSLQACVYLALTFFAQYFPKESRQDGLKRVKEFLLKDFTENASITEDWPEDIAWWDSRGPEDAIGKNPFRFGHTIAVGISSATQRAYGYVSFFSVINCSVDLGPVTAQQDTMVVVSINPEANKAGDDDVLVSRSSFCKFQTEPDKEWFEKLMSSGRQNFAMECFFTKVAEKHLYDFIEEIKPQLVSFPLDSSKGCLDAAKIITEKSGQRILMLLIVASKDLVELLSDRAPHSIIKILKKTIVADEFQEKGLTPYSLDLLDKAQSILSESIASELANSSPDFDKISMLIGGGLGMKIIVEKLLLPLIFSKKIDFQDSSYKIKYLF